MLISLFTPEPNDLIELFEWSFLNHETIGATLEKLDTILETLREVFADCWKTRWATRKAEFPWTDLNSTMTFRRLSRTIS
jgi:hypothetical protein